MSKRTVASLQRAIEQWGTFLRELKQQQRKYIARDFGIEPQHVFIGTRPCSESPTRKHVYNLKEDSSKTVCLYCKGQLE